MFISPFFLSKTVFNRRMKKIVFSFSNKIKYIFKFHAFATKNDFRNMSHLKPDFTKIRPTRTFATNNHNNQIRLI